MIRVIIKRIPYINSLVRKLYYNSQFYYDRRVFMANYSRSKETQDKIGYNMLLIVHSLEKGMSNKGLRKFGAEKVKELIELTKKFISYGDYENKFPFVCAINILRCYLNLYVDKGWSDADECKMVCEFLTPYVFVKNANVGSYVLRRSDFAKNANIDYRAFLASRHSVREYMAKRLSESDLKKAVDMAILSPSACNRQMNKVYYIKNRNKARKLIALAQGFGGFKIDTINLLIVTFDINANYMVGERNQGWLNAGLFSMNLVNAMHSIGIGSCFCQFGNSVKEEEEVKKIVGIPKNERVAVFIAAGYYCDEMLIPYSLRKPVDDICRVV